MAYTKNFTPEQQAEYAEKQKSDIDAMVKKIDEGVKAVFQSDKYKEYLKFASKFTDYSARNTMLINMDDKAYYVDSVGLKPLKEFKPTMEKQQEKASSVVEQEKAKPAQQKKIKM